MFIDAYAQNFWSPEIPESERRLTGWQALTHSARAMAPVYWYVALTAAAVGIASADSMRTGVLPRTATGMTGRNTAACPMRQCVWCLPGVDCITPISHGTITTATSTACSASTRRELPATAPKGRWAEIKP